MIQTRKINELRKFLNDDFEKNLLNSAILNLESFHSLTFNNFAYAMREIIRIVFHRLSPEDEIKKCSWYPKLKEQNDKITRRQRYHYAIHGGIGDFILKEFNLIKPIEKACDELLKQIDVLSNFTHIQKQTYNLSLEDTQKYANDCFNAVLKVFRLIKRVRMKLFEKIINSLDAELLDKAVSEYVEDIDYIAYRASVEEIQAKSFLNMKIDSGKIDFLVKGDVYCLLEYGNKSDWERNDGCIFKMSFDFKAPITLKIKKPLGRYMEVGKIDVNTDKFYQ